MMIYKESPHWQKSQHLHANAGQRACCTVFNIAGSHARIGLLLLGPILAAPRAGGSTCG